MFIIRQTVLYMQPPYILCFSCIYAGSLAGCGPGSSVGTATELRAGRSGIESRWGRDFPPLQTGPGAHPASCTLGTGSFPGVKCGRSVLLTTHPLIVPRSWKIELHLYPPSGPHWASNGKLCFYLSLAGWRMCSILM